MAGLIVYDSGSTTQTNTPTFTFMLAKDEINFVKSLRQFEVKTNHHKILNLFLYFSMLLKC
jgi:hypothetical protein